MYSNLGFWPSMSTGPLGEGSQMPARKEKPFCDYESYWTKAAGLWHPEHHEMERLYRRSTATRAFSVLIRLVSRCLICFFNKHTLEELRVMLLQVFQ